MQIQLVFVHELANYYNGMAWFDACLESQCEPSREMWKLNPNTDDPWAEDWNDHFNAAASKLANYCKQHLQRWWP